MTLSLSTDCVTNDCITSEEIRTLAGGPILEGADYILNTTETVAVVGINLLEFVGKQIINCKQQIVNCYESNMILL